MLISQQKLLCMQCAQKTSKVPHGSCIGQSKKKQLIQYFGGWKGLSEADVSQISKAPMIGQKLANKIYNYLHDIDLDS